MLKGSTVTITATRTRKATTGTDTAPATRTRKAAKVPTITHGPSGTVLVNAPYIVPGHGMVMLHLRATGENPLGWTWKREIRAFVMDGSEGKPTADMARVRECVDFLAGKGVTVDVKLTGTGKARATRAAKDAATVAEVPAPATPTRSRARGQQATATEVPASLADTIAAALASAGMPADVISAAIMGVSGAIKAPVRSARNAGVMAPATPTRSTRKAATGKPANGVTITMGDDGARCFTLPTGARTRSIAKVVRQAVYADMRAGGVCAGAEKWTVTADRDTRTLRVYRISGNSVSPDATHDAVILAAITGALA